MQNKKIHKLKICYLLYLKIIYKIRECLLRLWLLFWLYNPSKHLIQILPEEITSSSRQVFSESIPVNVKTITKMCAKGCFPMFSENLFQTMILCSESGWIMLSCVKGLITEMKVKKHKIKCATKETSIIKHCYWFCMLLIMDA